MSYHETMLLAAPLMTLLMALTLFQVKKRPIPWVLFGAAAIYFAAMTQQYGTEPWWSYLGGMATLVLPLAPLRRLRGAWRLDAESWLTGGLIGLATGLQFAFLCCLLYCSLQSVAVLLRKRFRGEPFPPVALMMLTVVTLMVTVKNIIPQWGFG